jgi:hypothetical protein
MGLVGVAALVGACSATTEDATVQPEAGELAPMAKRTARQLNLSHIECLEDGTVNAHFVLLFAGSANPGTREDNPQCEVAVSAHSFCDSPTNLGNPGAECAYLGLDWTSAKDSTGGSTASETAYVAIVKGGGDGPDGVCPQGEVSYNVYVNVVAGQTQLATGNGSGISHVTYCKCPTPQ